MKLFFYRREGSQGIQPNFGDELNTWLWDQLMPGVLDEDEETAFFGIGTLLNNLVRERAPNAKKIVVFGTGVGYSKGLPEIDRDWTIYCVRGPLSAYKLQLPPEFAVTDGAMLLRRVYKPTEPKRYKFAYMPHFTQSVHGGESWREVCEQAGVTYIDAGWSIEKVLSMVSQTEVMLVEAMHGAIIAEALRVPWICVHTAPERLLTFKWQDFCESIGVSYRPYMMSELHDLAPQYQVRNIRSIQGSRSAILASFKHWQRKQMVTEQLIELTKTAKPNLSQDDRIEDLTVELETRLEKFKQDVAAGRFR